MTPMKRFFLLLLIGLIPGISLAQVSEADEYQLRFVPNSFKEVGQDAAVGTVLDNFFDWKDKKYKDDNGQTLACLRIKITNMAKEDAKKLQAKVSSGVAQLKFQEYKEKIDELWLWVSPENFSIEVYGDGYKSLPYEMDRKLKSKHFYQLELTCLKQTVITLRTRPSDITMFLDNKIVEDHQAKVSSGTHKVSFSRNGADLRRDTTIVVSDANYVFFFDLRKKYRIKVNSEPKNADVFVFVDDNKKHMGTTPASFSLPEGSYRMVTTLGSQFSDTTVLNVSGNRNVDIQLERKKKVEFYAVRQGDRTSTNLYIKRLDRPSYSPKSSDIEGPRTSYSLTLPYGTYEVMMSNDENNVTRRIKISESSSNAYEFNLKENDNFDWPWKVTFNKRVSGLSIGYVQRKADIWTDKEKTSCDLAWGNPGTHTDGLRVGLHFQPCFSWGLGLYFGGFFEYYYSPTPSKKKDLTGEGPLEESYTSYSEKVLSVPLHLYYRIPFSKKFALSVHGGVDAEYLFGAAYKDSDGIYLSYAPPYDSPAKYEHLNFVYNVTAGIQYDWALFEASWCKGFTDHDKYAPVEGCTNTNINRINFSFSILF